MKYIILFALAVMMSFNALAQTFTVPAIPEKLSEQVKAELGKQRTQLEQKKNAIKAEVAAFNNQCTGKEFMEGDSMIDVCNNAHDRLEKSQQNFSDALEAFKADLAKALAAYVPAPEVEPITLNHTGDFYLLTKDGQKLTGADNVPFDGSVTFVTGADGQAELKLAGGLVLVMGGNSAVVPQTIQYDEHNALAKAIVELKKGVLHWTSAPVQGVQQKEVHTPMAVCVAKGTDFETTVNKDGTEQIKLFTGELEITETKTKRVFALRAQQTVTCNSSGLFAKPVTLAK